VYQISCINTLISEEGRWCIVNNTHKMVYSLLIKYLLSVYDAILSYSTCFIHFNLLWDPVNKTSCTFLGNLLLRICGRKTYWVMHVDVNKLNTLNSWYIQSLKQNWVILRKTLVWWWWWWWWHKMCNIEIVVGSFVFAVPSLTSAQCRLENVAYTHSIREASCFFNRRHFAVWHSCGCCEPPLSCWQKPYSKTSKLNLIPSILFI